MHTKARFVRALKDTLKVFGWLVGIVGALSACFAVGETFGLWAALTVLFAFVFVGILILNYSTGD